MTPPPPPLEADVARSRAVVRALAATEGLTTVSLVALLASGLAASGIPTVLGIAGPLLSEALAAAVAVFGGVLVLLTVDLRARRRRLAIGWVVRTQVTEGSSVAPLHAEYD